MKTDIFHIFIAQKFTDKKENEYSNLIERCVARKVMYINHIPLHLHNDFLSEMEELDLIKIKDKFHIEIL